MSEGSRILAFRHTYAVNKAQEGKHRPCVIFISWHVRVFIPPPLGSTGRHQLCRLGVPVPRLNVFPSHAIPPTFRFVLLLMDAFRLEMGVRPIPTRIHPESKHLLLGSDRIIAVAVDSLLRTSASQSRLWVTPWNVHPHAAAITTRITTHVCP